jgi:DeoR/GlpR family transcriptional regulator of sugar metabolism
MDSKREGPGVDSDDQPASAESKPTPKQRRAAIAEYVTQHGSAAPRVFAEMFSVSLMTIHRDFAELERQGLVRRFHGGVTARPSSVFESNVAYRLGRAQPEKEAMAEYVCRVVEPGMSVILDDSTSALAVAERLHRVGALTVITNFLNTIEIVKDLPDVRLIALGGEYSATHNSFLGLPCVEALASLSADVLITATSAVSGGVATHQEQEIVIVKRAMMESAARSILLVDHTKLGRSALHRVAPLSDFDLVVVDDGVTDDYLDEFKEQQVQIAVASAAGE